MFFGLLLTFSFYISKGSADCDVASVTTVSGTHAPQGKICSGDLIFEENFDTFDLKKWQHEVTLIGGGNAEFQGYFNNRSNSYTEDGILHIRPTLLADEAGEDYLYSGTLDINGGSPADGCTDTAPYGCSRTGSADNILSPVKSARLRTLYSLSFMYGKVEVRAKAPAGDWLWPAIWMLPRWYQYSKWPASGEIDIMETRGNRDLFNPNGVNIGIEEVGSTLHWGPNANFNRYPYTHYERSNASGFNADFHNFQLLWTPDYIQFSVDDFVMGRVVPQEGGFWQLGELDGTGLENPWRRNSKMAPFDQEFYLIINLAIGGVNYFPDEATNDNGAKPWLNTSPRASTDFWEGRDQWLPTWNMDTDDSHLQVDYVRIWAI